MVQSKPRFNGHHVFGIKNIFGFGHGYIMGYSKSSYYEFYIDTDIKNSTYFDFTQSLTIYYFIIYSFLIKLSVGNHKP